MTKVLVMEYIWVETEGSEMERGQRRDGGGTEDGKGRRWRWDRSWERERGGEKTDDHDDGKGMMEKDEKEVGGRGRR